MNSRQQLHEVRLRGLACSRVERTMWRVRSVWRIPRSLPSITWGLALNWPLRRDDSACFGRCGARAGEAPNRTTRQRPVSGLSALPAAGSPAQRSGDATRHRDAIGSGRAQFRSPPPLRSGGRGPGGGGSQGMHRHPVEPRPTFPPLPAQFAGGGAHPRHSPTPCRTPIEGLLSPALFAGERPGEGPLAATVCRLLHGT